MKSPTTLVAFSTSFLVVAAAFVVSNLNFHCNERDIAHRQCEEEDVKKIASALAEFKAKQRQYPRDLSVLGFATSDLESQSRVVVKTQPQVTSPNGDFIYLAANYSLQMPDDAVVLYVPMSSYRGDGIEVLFVDGRIEWLSGADAKSITDQVKAAKPVVRFSRTH